MAQSGIVISEMAAAAGLLPSTVDRMLRDLRAAGMAPMGKHGRGQEHGQYEPSHLANLLLSFAGPQPSDAAEAVRRLRNLTNGDGERLGDMLERIISDSEVQLPGWLSLCFEMPSGRMHWSASDFQSGRDAYTAAEYSNQDVGVTHATNVSAKVLLKAADLAQDMLKRQASHQTKNAAPGRAAPSTRTKTR